MPVCQSSQNSQNCPCSCTISEDGYWGNHPELGRNFTQVEGDGSIDNPFVFHFLDQEEFRPRTAEIKFADRSIVSGSHVSILRLAVATPRSFLIYESPSQFMVKDPDIANSGVDNYRYAGGNYFYVGATATFAAAGTDSEWRQIFLTTVRGTEFTGSAEYLVAGQTSPGGVTVSTNDPITLACGGMAPGVFFEVAGLGDIKQQFDLYAYQNSGSTLNITDIRLWLTQI